MRNNLEGDPTFTELLHRVREVALGAFAHQDAPFQDLVEELIPFPNPSYPPMVQISFARYNARREAEPPAGDLRMSLSGVNPGRAPFDLTLRMQEMGQGIICSLEYNTDLFHPATAKKMLERLRYLSEQVAADAELRLSQLILEV